MHNKRGQAAMEFLMTYGWALLVVLVSLGSLTFYFGYDNSSFASETCFFGPGLGCSDMLVNEDSISLKVMNSLGKDMTSFSVSSANCGVPSASPRLDNGDEDLFILSDCSFTPEDLIDESLSLTYTFIDSSLEHIKDATLTAVVEGGTKQSGGGSGGGYGSDGNTIALYKFDEGDGGVISDSSVNGLHGSFSTLGELIDNGGAETGTLDNFAGFDGFKGPSANCIEGDYCFYKAGDGSSGTIQSTNAFEVDMANTYYISGQFKSTGLGGDSLLYFGYEPFDENMIEIESEQVFTIDNTETELYEDIKSTDKIIKIVDGNNWVTNYNHERMAFHIDISGSFDDLPNRDLSNKDIVRVQPFGSYWEVEFDTVAGKTYSAGTKVRQHIAGGTYMYDGANEEYVGSDWTIYNGVTSGENIKGIAAGKWWPGTKFAKILFLSNLGQGPTYSLDIDNISVVSNPVTYTNKWTTGKFGTAIEFNGVDDYVEIPYNPNMELTDKFTLEFWMYPKSFTSAESRVIHRSGIWGVYFVENTLKFYTVAGERVVINYVFPPGSENQWYHVAGTYDGAEMKLFIDGVEIGIPVLQYGDINGDMRDMFIGTNSGSDRFFEGSLDEIRISDYVRYT